MTTLGGGRAGKVGFSKNRLCLSKPEQGTCVASFASFLVFLLLSANTHNLSAAEDGEEYSNSKLVKE